MFFHGRVCVPVCHRWSFSFGYGYRLVDTRSRFLAACCLSIGFIHRDGIEEATIHTRFVQLQTVNRLESMFSFSLSKSSPSTLSLTSCQSNDEFDDCCSQWASSPAPSPSRFNYEERLLTLFIQNQQSDSWSSSSPSPTRLDATPLGLDFLSLLDRVCSLFFSGSAIFLFRPSTTRRPHCPHWLSDGPSDFPLD